jgi:hypothetical protein
MRISFVLLVLFFSYQLRADDLLSNFCYSVIPGFQDNEVLAFCSDTPQNGISQLELELNDSTPTVSYINNISFPEGADYLHNPFLRGLSGEYRRFSYARIEQSKESILFASYNPESEIASANGIFVLQNDNLIRHHLDLGQSGSLERIPTNWILKEDSVWVSWGAAGLAKFSWSDNEPGNSIQFYTFDSQSAQWAWKDSCLWNRDFCDYGDYLNELENDSDAVWSIAQNEYSWWMGNNRGLWKSADGETWEWVRLQNQDSLRVSGIWLQEQEVLVEVSLRKGSQTQSSLWYSSDGSSFSEAGLQENFYDSLDVVIENAVWIDSTLWLAPGGIERSVSGLLALYNNQWLQNEENLDHSSASSVNQWGSYFYDTEDGFHEMSVPTTGLSKLQGSFNNWLVASTFGGGLSLSANGGKDWTPFLNYTRVKKDLAEIRVIPSILSVPEPPVRIAYQLSNDAKVSIEVYSYDMQKVRTIVQKAKRYADQVRSSDARLDVWDGKDDRGVHVGPGMYYIRVYDDKGHEGWTKVMNLVGGE